MHIIDWGDLNFKKNRRNKGGTSLRQKILEIPKIKKKKKCSLKLI